jgi:hypothetical protein
MHIGFPVEGWCGISRRWSPIGNRSWDGARHASVSVDLTSSTGVSSRALTLVGRQSGGANMGRIKSSLAVAVCALAIAVSSAGPALAGEVTGSGKKENQNQGTSWCSFSGLNDDPTAPLDGSGENGPGGQSQSYGQENKLGLQDPHESNPGTFCNPNKTPLPPQPNRTK